MIVEMVGTRRLAGVAVASAVAGAAVAAVATLSVDDGGGSATKVSAPCVEAWAHQQDATRFRPAAGEAAQLARFQSLLAVGTLSTGLCVQTDTEFYEAGWAITSVVVTATGNGEDGLPVTFTRAGTDKSEDLGLLYVPLTGCVDVRGTITATRTAQAGTATWTARGAYGRGCAQAPNHGAYPDNDGMLVQPSPK
ncbi:hypothetical protein [Nocardioides sp. Iso805N]|uniref:hypothetical protein n=1 Tax=Nocardioides sp. Iso805N TaxID=1283287 RepID=UPI00036AEB04|nr:hypothetical protein [Nocardioides sp. Iso805N]